MLLRIARAFEKTFGCRSNRKKLAFSLLKFYDAAKTGKKRLLKLAELAVLQTWLLKLTSTLSQFKNK